MDFHALFVRYRHLLIVTVLCVSLIVGFGLAYRSLSSRSSQQLQPGQRAAQEIAAAVSQDDQVVTASGAYVEDMGLLFYSRVRHTERAAVRAWLGRQVIHSAEKLAVLPQSETLTWWVDYGDAPYEQEILQVIIERAGDTASHKYTSATAISISTPTNDPGAPTADVVQTPEAVEIPPVEVPADPPTTQVSADVVPVAAEIIPAAGEIRQTYINDFTGGATSWLPLSGQWLAQEGVYIQQDASGFDYISILNTEPLSHFSLEANLRSLDGNLGGGFIYNAPDPTTRSNAQIVDFVEQGSVVRWGHYQENGDYVYDNSAAVTPPIADGAWHGLRLVTHGSESRIYVNGVELGTLQNVSIAGYMGLVTSQAQVAFDDVSVLALPEGIFEPRATLVTEVIVDDFEDGIPDGWQVLGGAWQVRDGAYFQTDAGGYDAGSLYNRQADTYTVTVRMRYIEGDMGAGLYYNAAQRDNKAQSQMVNFTAQGTALQWGAFDEGGNFIYQGRADVADGSDGEWHTLQVVVADGLSAIRLDDESVITDIPLTYLGGYIGLLSSTSHVAFDDFRLVTESETSTQVSEGQIDRVYNFEEGLAEGWMPFAGEWQVVDGTYEQQQITSFDRGSALDLFLTGPYAYSAKVRYLEGDMSGGLYFNMQQQSGKARSHIAAFTAQGTFLQWGAFGDGGEFVYQGGTGVPTAQDGAWHELSVRIREDTYDVQLDGVTIVTGVPVSYPPGYVGLFDSQSHVAFDDVHVVGPVRTAGTD